MRSHLLRRHASVGVVVSDCVAVPISPTRARWRPFGDCRGRGHSSFVCATRRASAARRRTLGLISSAPVCPTTSVLVKLSLRWEGLGALFSFSRSERGHGFGSCRSSSRGSLSTSRYKDVWVQLIASPPFLSVTTWGSGRWRAASCSFRVS